MTTHSTAHPCINYSCQWRYTSAHTRIIWEVDVLHNTPTLLSLPAMQMCMLWTHTVTQSQPCHTPQSGKLYHIVWAKVQRCRMDIVYEMITTSTCCCLVFFFAQSCCLTLGVKSTVGLGSIMFCYWIGSSLVQDCVHSCVWWGSPVCCAVGCLLGNGVFTAEQQVFCNLIGI